MITKQAKQGSIVMVCIGPLKVQSCIKLKTLLKIGLLSLFCMQL